MRINFFGDFVVQDISKISLSPLLKDAIDTGDFNVLNFEAPVRNVNQKKTSKSGPSISQDTNAPQWLIEKGFNVFCLANNHIFDYGEEGFISTMSSFKSSRTIGAGKFMQAFAPIILEKNGLKIAIFSLAEQQFGVFYDEPNDTDRLAAGWINHPIVENNIKEAKKKSDYVILVAHAGLECVDIPLPEWRVRFRQLIDAGCDVIVGGHTHCPQGIELYKDKLIFYSVGNFCFENKINNNSTWNIGEMVSLYIDKDGISYQCYGTFFSNYTLSLLDDKIWTQKFEKLNRQLIAPTYSKLVDEICIKHLEDFYTLCAWSGFIHNCRLTLKLLLKQIIIKYLHLTQDFSHLHMLNNLQCETHRWCFMRGLKLLKK